MTQALSGSDVLRWPIIGGFLRWRHARTTLQVLLLVAAAVVVLHGLFGPQIAPTNLATVLTWVHYRGLLVIVLLFAAWLGWKYWKRWSFIHDLRVSRVSPDELMRMMDAGEDVTIVDLRNALEFDYEGVKIPGSLWLNMESLEDHEHTFPREREVILYCS